MDNLFILSSSGEVLIEKHWQGKVKRSVCELFWEHVTKASSRAELPPVIATPKLYLVHVCRFDLSFLTAIDRETAPLLIIECQHTIIDTFLHYFKSLSESIIRMNFSTIYQLLDEMIDGAYPYTTEPNQLREMVIPPSFSRRMFESMSGNFGVSSEVPIGALTKIPWRKGDCKYVTNEMYFDIVEQIDATFNAGNNLLLYSSIYGEVKANCRLTGMPDLTLNFTRSNLLTDVSLHRCVRIKRYQREKVVSFVPPDGAFRLMSYRINGNTTVPIYVKPTITYGPNTGRVFCQVGAKHTRDQAITDVVIIIPLTKHTQSTNLTANVGGIKIDERSKVVRWVIGKLPRDKTPQLEGSISLPADFKSDERPTVRAEFQIKMYCVSGIKVDGLAIRGVKYKPFKGVRSVTQAGRFQIRT